MVLDKMEGNLLDYVFKKRSRSGEAESDEAHQVASNVTQEMAAEITMQVLQAVRYLHSQHICHRTIRLDHVLYYHPGDPKSVHIKLSGLGYARFCQAQALQFSPVGGVAGGVLPPEINASLESRHCEKIETTPEGAKLADIWSVGVIVYGMLTGRSPPDSAALLGSVASADLDSQVSATAAAMLRKLLNVDPGKRISAEDALQDPFLLEPRPAVIQLLPLQDPQLPPHEQQDQDESFKLMREMLNHVQTTAVAAIEKRAEAPLPKKSVKMGDPSNALQRRTL